MNNVQEIVENILQDLDNYLWGTCDLTSLLSEQFAGFNYGIVMGKRLDAHIIDSIKQGPTAEYYQIYNDTNRLLAEKTKALAAALTAEGMYTLPIKPTFYDYELPSDHLSTLRACFSHKMAATRAGLGWIGKTDLLITPEFGPRLRLATVLVDQPLKLFRKPVNESRCGDCDVCVRACPGHAATGKSWNTSVDRDEFYNAFTCRTTCRGLSAKIGVDASICGICVSVCPVGKH